MINTLKIFNELSQTIDTSAARKIAEVIGMVYEELQNTVTKVEFNELKEIVRELAEAQKRTEIEVRSLAITVKNMQKELGGISNTVGYELEDRFYPVFPQVLKKDFGVDIQGEMGRRFIVYPSGKDDEINIYGEGVIEGQKVYIIGESKAQIGKGDVRGFNKLLRRVKNHLGKKVIPILLCYSIHPLVETFIREEFPEIKVYQSHQLSSKMRR